MTLDITLEDPRWGELALVAQPAVAATLIHLGLDAEACEVSVLGCDDAHIAELNAEFRGKSSPTNVLSWPAVELGALEDGGIPDQPQPDFMGDIPLGDIAISFDTCAREAEVANKPINDHVTHLIVHGTLHLLGYDHERDADATLMEALEVEILGKMGLDNPYRN